MAVAVLALTVKVTDPSENDPILQIAVIVQMMISILITEYHPSDGLHLAGTVNVLKFRTLFSFCSQIKCWFSGLEFTNFMSE